MFNQIRADFNRLASPTLTLRAHRLLALRHLGFHALLVYRLGRWLKTGNLRPYHRAWAAPLWLVYGLSALWVRSAYGIHLALSADIGPGLFIGHIGGIHLHACQLGKGCNISQQVKITPWPGQAVGPCLGDTVWVGAHVQLLGPIQLGKGAAIAAGTRVGSNRCRRMLSGWQPRALPAKRL